MFYVLYMVFGVYVVCVVCVVYDMCFCVWRMFGVCSFPSLFVFASFHFIFHFCIQGALGLELGLERNWDWSWKCDLFLLLVGIISDLPGALCKGPTLGLLNRTDLTQPSDYQLTDSDRCMHRSHRAHLSVYKHNKPFDPLQCTGNRTRGLTNKWSMH